MAVQTPITTTELKYDMLWADIILELPFFNITPRFHHAINISVEPLKSPVYLTKAGIVGFKTSDYLIDLLVLWKLENE